MEEKRIVTVDLGTKKIGIAVSKICGFGRVEVEYYDQFPSAGISHGKVVNPTRLGAAVRDAISSTEEFLKIKVTQAEVNLQKYDVREHDFKFSIDITSGKGITAEDIESLDNMAWASLDLSGTGEEIYGLTPQGYDIGDNINVGSHDIVGMMGDQLSCTYKAYIGKANVRSLVDAAFTNAGISGIHSAFVPDKVGNAVLTETEMQGGVALLDIGAGASSVSIFFGGAMRHYGAIPFGGDSITTDIRNLCGIDERLAENIKLGYGGCIPGRLASLGEKTLKITDLTNGGKIEITAKYLSEIITARTKEIIDALLYEIQQSGYSQKLKHGIVVVGGCANMLNACELIKQMSGYVARPGIPMRTIFTADNNFYNPEACMTAALIIDYSMHCAGASGVEVKDGFGLRKSRPDKPFVTSGSDNKELEPGNGEITFSMTDGTDEEKETPKENNEENDQNGGSFGNFFSSIFGSGSKKDKEKSKPEKEEQPEPDKDSAGKKKKGGKKKPQEDSPVWGSIFGNDEDPENQI